MNTDLSVCIIAKNEEEMLRDCLESIKSVADEIILVDTGSDDNTIAIAQEFGAIIYNFPWQNDFALARNESIKYATKSNILIIDADERLANPEILKSTIAQSNPETGGWLIEVKSEATRQDTSKDTYISNLLRMFRRHPEIKFTGIIHEQFLESLLQVGYKIENTELRFIHLGYSHDAESMKKKNLRNLELLDNAIASKTDHGYELYHRAKTYLGLGDLDKAERDIASCAKILNHKSATYPQALNFGAVIAYQRKNIDLSIERAKKSITIVPNQGFANFILGESYTAISDFASAFEAYKKMKEFEGNTDLYARIIGDYNLPPEQLYFRLGRSLLGLKRIAEAEKHFAEGAKLNPSDTGNLVGLANCAFAKNEIKKAKTILENANSLTPGRPDILKFLSQVNAVLNPKDPADTPRFRPLEAQAPVVKPVVEGKPLLTLAMIVKDEEEMLPGCLESVKGVVDEIVIVDTGSKDATVSIAEKYGAKIFHFEWIKDFAVARNESIKHANGEWILYLDADERLTEKSGPIIKNLLTRAGDDIGGFICTLESPHIQLDGETELHRGGYPRLFRNYGHPKISFKGRVHEQITPSIHALGKSIIFSDVIIEHLGYDRSREVMEGKIKRNYEMLLAHVKDEPLSGYAWFQLGQTLANMRLFEEAEKTIRFSISTGNLSNSVFASAAASLSQLVGNQKKFEEALYWAERSLEKAPDQVYALNLKAYALMYMDKATESLPLFEEILVRLDRKKSVPHTGFDIVINKKIVQHGIDESKKKLGMQ
jgi:glycosyltransferase involved in cell wall biosynthesis